MLKREAQTIAEIQHPPFSSRIPAAIAKAEEELFGCGVGALNGCKKHQWLLHAVALAKALWGSYGWGRLEQFASESYLSSTEHLKPLREFTEKVESLD